MPGCFGLAGNAPYFPTDKMVEVVPRIDVWQLLRSGGLFEGAETSIRIGAGGTLYLRRTAGNLEIGGTCIAIVFDQPMEGCMRPWFQCPAPGCGRRRRHLYILSDRIACRTCAGPLDYQCRHRNRTVPGLNKALALRRKIGAAARIGAPIPPKPMMHRKYWRTVIVIRRLEAAVLGHVAEIADVLNKRHDRT